MHCALSGTLLQGIKHKLQVISKITNIDSMLSTSFHLPQRDMNL